MLLVTTLHRGGIHIVLGDVIIFKKKVVLTYCSHYKWFVSVQGPVLLSYKYNMIDTHLLTHGMQLWLTQHLYNEWGVPSLYIVLGVLPGHIVHWYSSVLKMPGIVLYLKGIVVFNT